MKPITLYRITYHEEDTPSGVVAEWFTTFNKAAKRLRQLGLSDSESVEVLDVTRTKVGLVKFLTTYAQIG